MPFTDEERRQWHEDKRHREFRPQVEYRAPPVAICLHCGRPFGISEGAIFDEGALCDICNGD